jgi:[protein-PII] uridylyltransferase
MQNSIRQTRFFAVGGYGRREMLPYSDVDIMILSEMKLVKKMKNYFYFISSFGMSAISNPVLVYAPFNCVEQATNDLTVATTLIEARLITGNDNLAKWPSHCFTNMDRQNLL